MSGVRLRSAAFHFLLAVALAGAVSGAALVLAGEGRIAGLAVGLAAWALVAAIGWARGSPRLLLLEAVAARAMEAAVIGALAWVALPEQARLATAAITALGASYLAAYLRVRSRGLGFHVTEPGVLRAAPSLLVALGLVAGIVEIALWSVVALSASTVVLEVVELGRQREPR
jgi:hypothetical protein